MMKTSIQSLPLELMTEICQFLSLKDLCSLRLSCDALKSKTYHIFAGRVFGEFYLALTSEGLQDLEYVAGHEIFRMHVKELWILPTLFCADFSWTEADIARVVQSLKSPRGFPPIMENPNTGISRAVRGINSLPDDPRRSVEEQHQVYKDAVNDHLNVLLFPSDRTESHNAYLRDTLETCLSTFINLRLVGLRNFNGHDTRLSIVDPPRKVRGLDRLRRQLDFNPVYPAGPLNAEYESARSSSFRGSAFQSYIFSTLLNAIAASHVPIEALETCGGMMVDDALTVSPAEEQALNPVLQKLQSLSACISSAHTQQKERENLDQDERELGSVLEKSVIWKERKTLQKETKNKLLPLLALTAPSLKSLNLTMRLASLLESSLTLEKSGLDLVDQHFEWISENFHFSRLSALSLSHLIVTVPSFKRMLHTTSPTLKELKLEWLIWTSDLKIPASDYARGQHQEVGLRVIRDACDYIRDNFDLQYLQISQWQYQREKFNLRDPYHIEGKSKRRVSSSRTATYDGTRDVISSRQWIDQVEFDKR